MMLIRNDDKKKYNKVVQSHFTCSTPIIEEDVHSGDCTRNGEKLKTLTIENVSLLLALENSRTSLQG